MPSVALRASANEPREPELEGWCGTGNGTMQDKCVLPDERGTETMFPPHVAHPPYLHVLLLETNPDMFWLDRKLPYAYHIFSSESEYFCIFCILKDKRVSFSVGGHRFIDISLLIQRGQPKVSIFFQLIFVLLTSRFGPNMEVDHLNEPSGPRISKHSQILQPKKAS